MNEIENKLTNFKDSFRGKYWNDPVWSKVIANAIIAIVGGVLTIIYALIKSYHEKVSFVSTISKIIGFFKSSTPINNLALLLSTLLLLSLLWIFFDDNALRRKTRRSSFEDVEKPKELPRITQESTVFFSYRISKAFPGQRGLKWYEGKTAIERFKILFQEPLKFKPSEAYGIMTDPIWWFRDSSSLYIDNFAVLSKTKVVLDVFEFEIKRIAVHVDELYYRYFIYVETKGEKQTGLYNLKPEDIKREIETHGYSKEEFGLFGKHFIRREQYDDGAAEIKGKVIDVKGAQLRVRYLSDYNFIIAAKQSPYNQDKFYGESEAYFNSILQGKSKPESLFKYLETFEKKDHW